MIRVPVWVGAPGEGDGAGGGEGARFGAKQPEEETWTEGDHDNNKTWAHSNISWAGIFNIP